MATLEFDQANHAILKIGDDEALDMVPFIAGVGSNRWLPSYTDYDFPDLDGTWVIVHEVQQPDGKIRYSSRVGYFRYFTHSFRTDQMISWTLWEQDGPIEAITQLDLDCRFKRGFPDDLHSTEVPDCWLSDLVDIPGSDQLINRLGFPVPYANIGASRISAVHPEAGVRLTMYRLEYD